MAMAADVVVEVIDSDDSSSSEDDDPEQGASSTFLISIAQQQQAPPTTMTQQAPPTTMTQQAPPQNMTPEVSGSRTVPFNLNQWLSPSRVAQPRHPPPCLPNLAQAALERLAANGSGGEMDDSSVDFKSPKKRKVQEGGEDDGDGCASEGQTCSICFEPWTNSGGHRIASLRCGHLFGYNCIEKWLKKAHPLGKCPQCNLKARRKDVRVIYAKSISVVDTTEKDRALKELEAEKASRIAAQKAEAQAVLQYQLARAECERLKQQLEQMRQENENRHEAEPVLQKSFSSRDGRYVLTKGLTVSQTGGCRVLAYNPLVRMLVASRPSNNQLVPGYGVLKLSTLDLHCSEYVSIHKGALRDMSFSPHDGSMLLSVGMDKTAKLTSLHSNATVQCYSTLGQVWACAWNHDNDHYFYCGLQNGAVQMFDTRNTAGSVMDLQSPAGATYPVTSLAFVPLCRASTLSSGGLLMGTLGGCVFWEKNQTEERFTPHALHGLPEGACTSLSFDVVTRHCLASHRPSKSTPHSRHTLFQLTTARDNAVSCHTLHQFTGGSAHKLLSHSRLFERPGSEGRLMAAFGDEATNTAHIWDVATLSRLQHLPADNQPTLDILPYASNGLDSLALLTESKVFIHQWQWS